MNLIKEKSKQYKCQNCLNLNQNSKKIVWTSPKSDFFYISGGIWFGWKLSDLDEDLHRNFKWKTDNSLWSSSRVWQMAAIMAYAYG